MLPRQSIEWVDDKVRFIDQRLLPKKLKIIETDDWHVIANAIKGLGLRGAPLIGVAAALGVAVTAVKYQGQNPQRKVLTAIDGLYNTRPTAVNLFWALDQMKELVVQIEDEKKLSKVLVNKALEILEDDRNRCSKIGKYGSSLIKDGANILTVCNTGFLATAGIGTALAAVYNAHDEGKNIHVYACETRPLLQGARLTAWELKNAGIPFTLIVDSAAAGLLAMDKIDLCIIGADRIAANGDVANKVGSYQLALACKEHNVPYYVAAPESTMDWECPSGSQIPLEDREPDEVTSCIGKKIAPDDTPASNPAFDVVPTKLISGFITEKGIMREFPEN
ncbi:MAG: S-methyl-5-thioribose-1-phosphate isomerase [Candidatus Hatepunaea meridiana]|nr:S-methyl-5-thioribose-1-phosphate isomerase [Candidatus Hatepunaea meridiana]